MNLEEFRGTSDAFLFAERLNAPGTLVYLEQGTADEARDFTKQSLRCPEPDCGSPALTTVNRALSGRRDGYRHLRSLAIKHAPESVMHRQAKAMVAHWAEQHRSVAAVQVEARLGGGERIADVLLTSHSGKHVAIEVQFAGLPYESWLERTESYGRLGVPVVWLFGSRGALSPREGRLRDIHREVVTRRNPLLWISPSEETVAWLSGANDLLPVVDEPRSNEIRFGTLADLDLRAGGLYPPGFLAARESEDKHVEEQARIAQEKREAELARLRARSAEARAARRTWQDVPLDVGGHEQTPPDVASDRPPQRLRCRRCGWPLDPVLAGSGVHVDPYCASW